MDGVWRESGEDINTPAGKPHRWVESSVKDGAVTRKNPEIATYGVMLTRLLARPDVQPPPAPPALRRSDKWLTTNRNIPKRDAAADARSPNRSDLCVYVGPEPLLKSNFRSLPRSDAIFSNPANARKENINPPTPECQC